MDKLCLFCGSEGPFSIEHIIPESLGNDDLVLHDEVCSRCNNYFSKIEGYVLQKTPFAFWRTYLGIRSKKGDLPSVDFSQPNREKGTLPCRHPSHADHVGFSAHEDGSTSLDVDNDEIIRMFKTEKPGKLNFVMTPKMLHELSRFLCKIGVEMLCHVDREEVREPQYKLVRDYARHGFVGEMWPVFHFSEGDFSQFRRFEKDEDGYLEVVDLYKYSFLNVKSKYLLFYFSVGTDNWVICLNDKWPTPEITEAFPGRQLSAIWYPPESYKRDGN